MCADISSGESLKKAVRKHEKKLRQILNLEEQSGSRELTKEEIEKVQSKENVLKELNELQLMIESTELQYSNSAQADKDDDEGMVDSTASNVVSEGLLTPTKRPHVMDLPSPESQNNFTKTEDETLLEPESKRRKKRIGKGVETQRDKGLSQMWCDKHFIVSKLDGHNDVICSLDCNEDLLLTGSRDTSLKVWSLHTFEMLHHMGGHTSVITCVRLVPESGLTSDLHEKLTNHKVVVGLSGSLDCSVKMWNLDTGHQMCSVYVFSPVTCMDYWCDGKVVIGTEGGKVDVWDLKKGDNTCTIRCSMLKSKPVTCLKVYEGHVYCADSSVQKWQLGSDNHPSLLLDTGHTRKSSSTIQCICIHGNNIFWGDNGVNLKVYNCITRAVKKYPTHSGKHVVTGAMATAGDVILCAGYDEDQGTSYINVHSLHDGKYISTLSDNSNEYITCIAGVTITTGRNSESMMSSSASIIRVITGGNNAELKVWDSLSEESLPASSLKSYQHTTKTFLHDHSLMCEHSCETDSNRSSDDNCSTKGDIEADVDLHNQPLPIPRQHPVVAPDSQWWCSII